MRLMVIAASFVGGSLFAHALDAPHMVYPAEFRLISEAIVEAIEVTTVATRLAVQGQVDSNVRGLRLQIRDDDKVPYALWQDQNHRVTSAMIGNCALSSGHDILLLGDRTASPPGVNDFTNIGGKVCWSTASGLRVPCPPPTPPCTTGK